MPSYKVSTLQRVRAYHSQSCRGTTPLQSNTMFLEDISDHISSLLVQQSRSMHASVQVVANVPPRQRPPTEACLVVEKRRNSRNYRQSFIINLNIHHDPSSQEADPKHFQTICFKDGLSYDGPLALGTLATDLDFDFGARAAIQDPDLRH